MLVHEINVTKPSAANSRSGIACIPRLRASCSAPRIPTKTLRASTQNHQSTKLPIR